MGLNPAGIVLAAISSRHAFPVDINKRYTVESKPDYQYCHQDTVGLTDLVDQPAPGGDQSKPPIVAPESNTSSLVCPEDEGSTQEPENSQLCSEEPKADFITDSGEVERLSETEINFTSEELPSPPTESEKEEEAQSEPGFGQTDLSGFSAEKPDFENLEGSEQILLENQAEGDQPRDSSDQIESLELSHTGVVGDMVGSLPSVNNNTCILSEEQFSEPHLVEPSEKFALCEDYYNNSELDHCQHSEPPIHETSEVSPSESVDLTEVHSAIESKHPATESFELILSESTHLDSFETDDHLTGDTSVAQVDFVPYTETHSADQTITLSLEHQTSREQSTPITDYKFESDSAAVTPTFVNETESSGHWTNTAAYDASMDTTVGVSEIMADAVAQDYTIFAPEETPNKSSIHEDLSTHPPGSYVNGLGMEYRNSYDGGSSYHDDVPPEEEDEAEGHFTEADTTGTCVESENKSDDKNIHSGSPEENKAPSVIETREGLVDDSPRPSFHEICEVLDKKK
ncbi:hypothetical protein FBUS_02212 [Fasciolopsis buskii]|uniref:Uncharacterized protein n=1 Tax=Fasciolopsis buskii TaxID=27845 RepID=A0A8E0RN16_9TREM|nr:hypothetical protein FBUS_02212 [Fasciolopsis buski]